MPVHCSAAPSFPTRRSSDLGSSTPPLSAQMGLPQCTLTHAIAILSVMAIEPSGLRKPRSSSRPPTNSPKPATAAHIFPGRSPRSEEHTSELQSPDHLVYRLL